MAAISGQKAVTTAGTAVALVATEMQVRGTVTIKALTGNTGFIYVGNDGAGDVTSSNGIELDAGESLVFDYIGDLRDIIVDSSVNGEGVGWFAAI